MAAGEARRLRPVSERWPKPVLPIDGRPVIASLLRELAAAGISRVTVVRGYLGAQIERLLGDGVAFGIAVSYATQARPLGSADAVRSARKGGATPPFLIVGADTLFRPGDLGRFAKGFTDARADGALAVRRQPPPGEGRGAVRVEAGRVRRVLDDEPENPLSAAPLWGFSGRLDSFLEGLRGPPFELAEVYQRAIDEGLEIAALEIGVTRDLTFPVDLVKENFPYLSDES